MSVKSKPAPGLVVALGFLLPLLLVWSAARAQDSPAVVARFEALSKNILTGSGRPASAPKAGETAYEMLERNGLLALAQGVVNHEEQAQRMMDNQLQLVMRLNAEVEKLGGAAGSAASSKGQGGIGQPGTGWYCQRAAEMMPQLGSVASVIDQQARTYANHIGQVPLGEGSESTRRLSELANSFNANLQQILANPPTQSMIKDLKTVAEGLSTGKALEKTADAGKAAAAAANELRAEASKLQDVGVKLIPMLQRYVEARLELGQEIAALTPLVTDQRRADALKDLARKVRESRRSPRSPDEWQKLIRATVNDGYAVADKRLETIRKLQDPATTELQACKDDKNLPMNFARARLDAHEKITRAQQQVEQAVGARAALIDKENKALDQATLRFELTETEAATKAKAVFAQLQTIDRRSDEWREKEKQYDRLEALRKKARAGIDAIREQRNEYAKERQDLAQSSKRAASDLAALMARGPGGN